MGSQTLSGAGRGRPRSTDLSPVDFFLWSFVKGLIYDTSVSVQEDLQGNTF